MHFCVVIPWGEKTSTTESQHQSVKIYMLFATIDRMLAEFDRRFSDNIDILRSTSVFNPGCVETFRQNELINTINKHYNNAGIDTDSFQSQLATAKSSRPNDIFAFRDTLSSPDAFIYLLKLGDNWIVFWQCLWQRRTSECSPPLVNWKTTSEAHLAMKEWATC